MSLLSDEKKQKSTFNIPEKELNELTFNMPDEVKIDVNEKKETVLIPINDEESIDLSVDDITVSKYDVLLEQLLDVIKKITELQKEEKQLIKRMSSIHNSDVKRAKNKKRKANPEATGFAKKKVVGGKLADWLKIERGTELTGPEISKTFWKRIIEEGLQSNEDKRLFRTNKEVTKIFGVPEKVNTIMDPLDKNGFNMRTYQTHITYALTNNNS